MKILRNTGIVVFSALLGFSSAAALIEYRDLQDAKAAIVALYRVVQAQQDDGPASVRDTHPAAEF